MTAVRRYGTPACEDRPVADKELRNPFRSEADAFRVLVMFVVAAAAVIASAVLISTAVGAILAVIAIAIGLWRSGSWLGQMLGEPDDDVASGPKRPDDRS